MSEDRPCLFDASFNRAVKVRSSDHRLSSDGGVLLLREADEKLGLVESLVASPHDPRSARHVRYTFTELLRERIFAEAQGYGVRDDLDTLAHDPAFRLAAWDRPGERVLDERLASQPTHSRLVSWLAHFGRNRAALTEVLSGWLERHVRGSGDDRSIQRATIDVDSFPISVYGSQAGGAFNGYYREKVYHPLVAMFSAGGTFEERRLGDGFVNAVLREGHVPSADGAVELVRETVERCGRFALTVDVRFDAGFADGKILDALTDSGIPFVARLPTNPVLQSHAARFLERPVGRPPQEGYEKTIELLWHQAETWKHAQRVVLVVVDRPDPKTGQLNLFPRTFFLVTKRTAAEISAEDLLAHYRNRGTFEDRLGEFQSAITPRCSSPGIEENEVHLLLAPLSYNLVSMLRGEIETITSNGWDLERIQRTVLKAGARVTRGGRRLFVDIAHAVGGLWTRLFQQIRSWKLSTHWKPPAGATRRHWNPPPRHAHLELVLRE